MTTAKAVTIRTVIAKNLKKCSNIFGHNLAALSDIN